MRIHQGLNFPLINSIRIFLRSLKSTLLFYKIFYPSLFIFLSIKMLNKNNKNLISFAHKIIKEYISSKNVL